MNSKPIIFSLVLSLVSAVFLPAVTQAASPQVIIKDSAYSATLVNQSVPDPITIPAGSSKTVVFTFKNTGTATWASSGKFISAYSGTYNGDYVRGRM